MAVWEVGGPGPVVHVSPHQHKTLQQLHENKTDPKHGKDGIALRSSRGGRQTWAEAAVNLKMSVDAAQAGKPSLAHRFQNSEESQGMAYWAPGQKVECLTKVQREARQIGPVTKTCFNLSLNTVAQVNNGSLFKAACYPRGKPKASDL